MKCPYCDKVTPARLDSKGNYWTFCVPCGMKGIGKSASPTAEDKTAKATKPRNKKPKSAPVDNIDDAPISKDGPD